MGTKSNKRLWRADDTPPHSILIDQTNHKFVWSDSSNSKLAAICEYCGVVAFCSSWKDSERNASKAKEHCRRNPVIKVVIPVHEKPKHITSAPEMSGEQVPVKFKEGYIEPFNPLKTYYKLVK